MSKKSKLLIFTDLDGTLLNHDDYSHAAADVLLGELDQAGIPVIPTTSKTADELIHIRTVLNNEHPFIIENGAAIYIPKDYFPEHMTSDLNEKDGYFVKTFTQPRKHWQELIDRLRPQFDGRYITFEQAGIEGIIKMTGLDRVSSARAANRGFGEPVAWMGDAENKQLFISQLESLGACVLKGGRFMHVSGPCDKGHALQWLKKCYQESNLEENYRTLALGDSQNDIAMLEEADFSVLVHSPAHAFPFISKDENHYKTKSYGSLGWVEGVTKMLSTI